jgi:hypothetical protein
VVNGSNVRVTSVAGSAREAVIGGLGQLTRHSYRVRALGAVSGEHSPYTAEAAATLPSTLEVENLCRVPLTRIYLNGVEWHRGSVNLAYQQRQAVDAAAGVVDVVVFFNVWGENPWFSLSQRVTLGLDRTVRISFERELDSIDILTRTQASYEWWLLPFDWSSLEIYTHYVFRSDGSYELRVLSSWTASDYTITDRGFVTHLGTAADGSMTFLLSSTMGGPVVSGTIRNNYVYFDAPYGGRSREWYVPYHP